MRVRFVRRDGWEKWLDVDARLPPTWVVADTLELKPFTESYRKSATRPKERVFMLQTWHLGRWPDEHVYVEEDHVLRDRERFGETTPSLHRERLLLECLRGIQRALDDAGGLIPGSHIGEVIAAAHALERVRAALHRSRLGKHYATDSERQEQEKT